MAVKPRLGKTTFHIRELGSSPAFATIQLPENVQFGWKQMKAQVLSSLPPNLGRPRLTPGSLASVQTRLGYCGHLNC